VFSQSISAGDRELPNRFGAVTGIRPSVVGPLLADVIQRDFRKDLIPKIDPMVSIFDRRKHKFGLGQIPWVQIDRSTDFIATESPLVHFLPHGLLPQVGLDFPVC